MRSVVSGLCVLGLATYASGAYGATFTVNSTADTTDGACSAVIDGCTLREAIEAVVATPGRDAIGFDPTVFTPDPKPKVVLVTSALPIIADGAGTVLDGAGASVVIKPATPAGSTTTPLVFASGPGVPLAKVTVANVTIVDFEGRGIVICGGTFPVCGEDVSGTVVQNVVAERNKSGGILVKGTNVTKTRIVAAVVQLSSLAGIELAAGHSLLGTRIERVTVRLNGMEDEDLPGLHLHAAIDVAGTVVSDAITVQNSGSGLLVSAGQHATKTKVKNVASIDNSGAGIVIAGGTTSATTITNTLCSYNKNPGISVFGDTVVTSTTLKDVVANSNQAGIDVSAGDTVVGATITNATALGNASAGITLLAPNGVHGAKVTGAVLTGNGLGLRLHATASAIKRVRADRNGAGIQLDGPGGGNSIEACTAHFNNGPAGGAGIVVGNGSTGNLIKKNAALFNDGANLDDGNPNCDGNVWTDNLLLQTPNDPCIH